jgi:hypothetical protein
MSFEVKVLAIANRSLKQGESAEFFAGSLFLKCSENTSRIVFSDLFMATQGKVQVSKTPAEFVIDFVA